MRFLFAWRYLKAGKSTQAINIIAWVSVSAIMVGSASLIIILSAFNGFEGLVKSLYSSFYPELRIEASTGKRMQLSAEQAGHIRSHPSVKAMSLVAEQKGMLQYGEYQVFVQVRGVDTFYRFVSGVPEKVIRGQFRTGSADQPKGVLGAGVENALGLLSDRSLVPVTVYMPRQGSQNLSDPMSSLSQSELMPAGSFAVQPEFDNKYVITSLGFVQQQLQYNADQYSAAELALKDPGELDRLTEDLKQYLGDGYRVLNRYEQNRNLYATIRLEKWAIYAIFSLILLVAAFNMIGALSMLVLEKQKDIQVLQAMGAEPRLIRGIFFSEGILLAGIGMVLGMSIALLLCYLQMEYKIVPLEGSTFLIDHYPVRLEFRDFVLVGATTLAIGALASFFPAGRAARQPLDMRN